MRKENKISKTFFISDLHFGHKNILQYDSRPFFSITKHDDALIENWNKTVSDIDTVYILGDISWYETNETIEIVKKLKGHKHLIIGNHDSYFLNSKEFVSLFESISNYKEIRIGNHTLILSHYPIPCFNKHFYGTYHFYGHVHRTFEWNMMKYHRYLMETTYNTPCNMFNVGCMMPYIDYTPRTFDEIINQKVCPNVEKYIT